MNLSPVLRSQTTLLDDIRRAMRDTDRKRWTDAEIYDSINAALREWEGRVQIPHYYNIDFSSGTYEYTLPTYIDAAQMDVQIKRTVWGLNTETGDEWEDVYTDLTAWHVIPSATGGVTLLIDNAVNTQDGRIIWWGHNGSIATTACVSNAELVANGTSLVLSVVVPNIGRAGFLKVGQEWMAYAGVSDDGTKTTLNNLVRGLEGSTAAIHAAGATVAFGVAAPNENLFQVLFDQVARDLHRLFLTNGAPNESEHHERLMGYHEQRVQAFWRMWVPARPPQMRLSRRGMGVVGDDSWDFRP